MRNTRSSCSRSRPLHDIPRHSLHGSIISSIRPASGDQDKKQQLVKTDPERIAPTAFHELDSVGRRWVADGIWCEPCDRLDCRYFLAKDLETLREHFTRRQDAEGVEKVSTELLSEAA